MDNEPLYYVDVATERAIDRTLTYHVPPELKDILRPGHLVRLDLRTAAEPGIIVRVHDQTPAYPDGKPIKTKPVLEMLDPEPVVTPAQLALAQWLSQRYLAALGPCLWLMLPPGMVGKRDVLAELKGDLSPDATADQIMIVDALKRRGKLSGTQLGRVLKSQPHAMNAIRALEQAGVIHTESILSPPRVKPQKIDMAWLAIHPDHIPHVRRKLGKSNRIADALEAIIRLEDDEGAPPHISDILAIPGVGQGTLDALLSSGWVDVYDDEFLQPHADADEALFTLRGGETDLRVLNILARSDKPVEVSWLYAQANTTREDLRRLEEYGLIHLGEQQKVRDSLAEREFVPSTAPRLTPGQRSAWQAVREALDPSDLLPASPAGRGGATASYSETSSSEPADLHDNSASIAGPDSPPSLSTGKGVGGMGSQLNSTPRRADRWLTPPEVWRKIKPLAQEKRNKPTLAENRLWEQIREKKLQGFKFRRQHPIDRFIVDFYCSAAHLIIEVDGPVHQYQPEEDAIRQEFLEAIGFRVLRFTNEQIFSALDAVLEQISAALLDHLPAFPASRGGAAPSYLETSSSEPADSLDNSANVAGTDSPPSLSTGKGVGGMGSQAIFLLHGVTGSGKTEIYLRAIERVLEQGRQAIFLVPEIALTAQTIRRVAARFPGKVAVIHSGLNDGERYDTWHRARMGEIAVVVGARSALFTPLPDVGLIVMDEEHDSSYKQSPPVVQPFYHARDVAERMMRDNNGVLILGSATPDVETMFRALRGDIQYLHLPDRIMGHRVRIQEQSRAAGVTPSYSAEDDHAEALTIPLPAVEVVDMRAELRQGNTGMFSLALQDALAGTLVRGEQAILFLNRRGTSTYVFCRICGYVVNCKNCSMPMIFHSQDGRLHCHHCGRTDGNPQKCPSCGSNKIRYFGAGTQNVETTFAELFPGATALRWDGDAVSRSTDHDLILQRFMRREADVLIGTQMIAKGLDLPLVTLVGVVSADVGLNLPDFRAGERSFQLLTQVAGRAGRGLLGGRVILQTYQPEHYAVQAASQHDYAGFYEQEIAFRREMGYPPFRRFARILFTDPTEHKVRHDAEQTAEHLQQVIKSNGYTDTHLIGPAPSFYGRINRMFRWQILLRGPDPSTVLQGIDFGPRAVIDIDPADVL